jgi:putative transposase
MIFAAIADWVESEEFTVEFMCTELNVSRSGYYAWRHRAPSARSVSDTELSVLIADLHATSRGNAGVRRIRADLAHLGRRVSGKRVHRLMQDAGLQGRHPKAWKHTTIRGHDPVPVPDRLKQDFTATAANQRWVGDITYVKTWQGWAYTATVIDLFSRKIVGWACADHMRTSLVTDALTMALTHRKPTGAVIFHSDRGTQYTSQEMVDYCRKNNVSRSMGRTGTCYDNAVAESFFATYKKELIHTRPWDSVKTLKRETFDWIETYYNRRRRHSTIAYLTPHEYELLFNNTINQAA